MRRFVVEFWQLDWIAALGLAADLCVCSLGFDWQILSDLHMQDASTVGGWLGGDARRATWYEDYEGVSRCMQVNGSDLFVYC